MKKFLLFVMMGALGFSACTKDGDGDSVTSITLGTPSKTAFDYKGGLGSVEVYAGNKTVTAESSAPDWCRVTVFDNKSVAFNLYQNSDPNNERSATITVKAEGLPSVHFDVTQDRLRGIIVSPTVVNFSSEQLTQSIEVLASGDYTIVADVNPDNTFTWEKSANGRTITFSSQDPGFYVVEGRVSLVPEEGEGEPVAITLLLEKMSTYDLLLGEWKVNRADDAGELTRIIFTEKVWGYTYNTYFKGIDYVGEYPFTMEYVDGEIFLPTGQSLGYDGSYYYTMHFNGPKDGSGWYIWSSPGVCSWVATVDIDELTRTINLSFADSSGGYGAQAQSMVLWQCTGAYFSFTTNFYGTDHLDISKTY